MADCPVPPQYWLASEESKQVFVASKVESRPPAIGADLDENTCFYRDDSSLGDLDYRYSIDPNGVGPEFQCEDIFPDDISFGRSDTMRIFASRDLNNPSEIDDITLNWDRFQCAARYLAGVIAATQTDVSTS